jgi:hypothetical protein
MEGRTSADIYERVIFYESRANFFRLAADYLFKQEQELAA